MIAPDWRILGGDPAIPTHWLELRRDGDEATPESTAHVQNAQKVQNQPPELAFEHSEQIEQRTESDTGPSPAHLDEEPCAASPAVQNVQIVQKQGSASSETEEEPGRDGWSAEDYQAYFEERAAIVEFDGGLQRSKAETVAHAWTAHEWLAHHFAPSPAGCCAHCGGPDRSHDALLPHGMTSTGHIWTHSSCGPAWHAGRQAEAVAALAAMGLPPPDETTGSDD
jgi:hypothetical protein